jgi:hypothetical protein
VGPSTSGNETKRASRALTIAAVVVAIALIALLVETRRGGDSTPPATAATEASLERGSFELPPPRIRTYAAPATAPIIDEIVLEKTSLCAGEELLVTVKAHAADPDDDIHLHAVIDGKPGMSVPLVAQRNRGPDSPRQMVAVFGRDDTRTTAELPPYEVVDCVADRALKVGYRLLVNTNAEYAFTADILNLNVKEPFEAASYTWDFGDGTTITTQTPTATHDFGARRQDALYSNMLVRVEARSRSGEVVVGRHAISMRNAAFSNLVHAGVVTLVVELTPRFPVVEHGVVKQGIRLWHHRPEPLQVKRLRTRRNSAEPGTAPLIEPVSIAGTLGTTTIPPSGITFELTLDANAEPDLRSIDFLLDGVSADGIPVKSVFSVMKPSALPTPDNSEPVSDPLLTAKILRARKVLGKDYVTDEDLWRLQRQGDFDDLSAAAEPTAPATSKLPPIYVGHTP